MLKLAAPQTKRRQRRETSGDEPYCRELFAKLREERRKAAQAQGLPPYIIFTDQSLREMSRLCPETPETLLNISGVGRKKLETYGPTFIQVIRDYLFEHPEQRPSQTPSGHPGASPASPSQVQIALSKTGKGELETVQATADLLDMGLGLFETAQKRKLQPQTILRHMETLITQGRKFPASQFLTPERLLQLKGAFKTSGGWRLRTVVEQSQGGIGYLEARLARLLLKSSS